MPIRTINAPNPTESNGTMLALARWAATNVPPMAPDMASPIRSRTCATRTIRARFSAWALLSFDMIKSFLVCLDVASRTEISERIITNLGHHDVVVRPRRAADAFKGKALVVGILRADLDRPIRTLEQGVVEADGVLPDFRGIAVAGGRRRILDVAAGVVV